MFFARLLLELNLVLDLGQRARMQGVRLRENLDSEIINFEFKEKPRSPFIDGRDFLKK